ncbi:hypothetical protein [Klebsiella sp. WP3-S18-ESBL-05]|uniref:hypothetical protein n=1 Tax=Klebsiella sp. WP3-S18-ESBL-05 TaxID=2675711 RepID=UPI0039B84E50
MNKTKGCLIANFATVPKKVRISLMMLLTIEGGKIKEKRAHFDYNDIVRQIS